MWSRVVLPELSRPRKRILASFCQNPRDASTSKSQSTRNDIAGHERMTR